VARSSGTGLGGFIVVGAVIVISALSQLPAKGWMWLGAIAVGVALVSVLARRTNTRPSAHTKRAQAADATKPPPLTTDPSNPRSSVALPAHRGVEPVRVGTKDAQVLVTRTLPTRPTPAIVEPRFEGYSAAAWSPPSTTATQPMEALDWIPLSRTVTVAGLRVGRGGFYVQRTRSTDPVFRGAVIEGRPVDTAQPDWNTDDVGYYPAYHDLSPRQRAAFLAFLHSDRRRAAVVSTAFLWLYLYNIEWRLLADPRGKADQDERRALLAELRTLRSEYPESGSLQGYVSAMIVAAELADWQPSAPIPDAPWPPAQGWNDEVRVGLGHHLAAEVPIHPDWAFQWALLSHERAAGRIWECVFDDARSLFTHQLRQRYPMGLRIARGKSKLSTNYRFASSDHSPLTFRVDMPDPERLTAPIRPLVALLDEVLTLLEPLRKVRRRQRATRADELAAYPPTLARLRPPAHLAPAREALTRLTRHGTFPDLPVAHVFALLRLPAPPKLAKRELVGLAQVLELIGFGMEPDPRFTATIATDRVFLFECDHAAPTAPSNAFSGAIIMLVAGLNVAKASEVLADAERDAMVLGIARHFGLGEAEVTRLRAHLRYLHISPIAIGKVTSRLKALPIADREALASVLVSIAASDGHVDAAEMAVLERLYRTVGIDTTRLHADVHRVTSGGAPSSAPVAGRPTAAPLDASLIAQKLEETERIQSVLHEIFSSEDEPPPTPTRAETPPVDAPTAAPMSGLAPELSAALTQALALGPSIERSDWDRLCADAGVMPDGALEAVNEWAFDNAGDALLEGDDPLEVSAFVADALGITPVHSS